MEIEKEAKDNRENAGEKDNTKRKNTERTEGGKK